MIRKLINILFRTLAVLVMILVLILILFSIPRVQTYFAKKTTSYLKEQYGTDIELKGVRLGVTGDVVLKDLFVRDHHNDTLVLAEEVRTSLKSAQQLLKGDTQLQYVDIKGAYVKMSIYPEDDKDNMRVFLASFNKKKRNKTTPFQLHIDQVKLHRSRYAFFYHKIKETPIVDIKDINLKGEDLHYRDKQFHITATESQLLYNDHISVTQFSTDFTFVSDQLTFDAIELKTKARSDIKGDLKFYYESGDFGSFDDCVVLDAKVKRSKIATNDIKLFYDKLGSNELFSVSTNFYGVLNDFNLHKLRVYGLGTSRLNGEMSFLGLRSKDLYNDFKYKGDLKLLRTNKTDLERLLPSLIKGKLPKELDDFGVVRFEGKVLGTTEDVDFKGDFESELGKVSADMRLENVTVPTKTLYNGHLNVIDFELGSYFNNPKLGLTSFDLNVNGKGFVKENLSTVIEGNFSKLTYNKYQYKNINVFGVLDDPVFDGKIVAKDPNFDLFFDGKINLDEGQNDYDFKANVNFIDLNKTNLTRRDSIATFKGQVRAKLKGTSIDNVVGTIDFKKTIYKNQNDTYSFKDFNMESSFLKNGNRKITLNSPEIITGYLKGNFLVKDIERLVRKNVEGLYLGQFKGIDDNTEVKNLDFDLKIYNKILGVFYPELNVASNTFLKGYLSDNLTKTKLNFNSPEVTFEDKIIKGLNLFVDKSKSEQTVFKMEEFRNKWYPLSNFEMRNQQVGDSVITKTQFKAGKKLKDQFDFRTYFIPSNVLAELGISKGYVNFKNNNWDITKSSRLSNKIYFDKVSDSINVLPIKLTHKEEEILFTGKSKDSTYKDFNLSFKDVDLEKISPSIDSLNYYGNLNGRLLLKQKGNLFLPEIKLKVDDFTINEQLMGDLSLFMKGNEQLTTYILQGALENSNYEGVNLNGKIEVKDKKATVDADVLLGNFDVSPFSPLGGEVITNIRGKASGKLKIKGDVVDPDYKGKIRLNKAGVKIPYLNVDLALEENSIVAITKNNIEFEKQTVTDTAFNTEAAFEGNIAHQNFSDWELDLSIKSPRILVLNTTAADNDLYYGTAFIDGYATLKGSTAKPIVNVVASSGEGTTFKIPISDTESIGDNSFIHFITPKEKLAAELGGKYNFEDINGVELQFELDLNQNAEVEIVVDQESGSALRGYGAGTLLIEINTNGKFNIWGDFVAYKGTYDFKYGGVLSKSFEVESGGSINWNGSPTGAFLNLSAVYNTNANPAILLENSTVNRKIPVQVVTSLQGELLKPDLNFDVKFPRASSVLRSELDFILADQTIKERQAFSLVTQGQFYNDALINGNNLFVENLIVERASSIVNSLFASEEDKFKVGLNYVAGERNPDQDIADQVGVSLSTQINDRILINGKVGVPVGGISESVVVGDVQIDFLLNEEGSLRATIFNKENDLQFIGETIGFTQGVGISYSYDFDTFKELLRKVFVRAKKDKQDQEE